MIDIMWEVQTYELCPDLAARGRFLQSRIDAYNIVGQVAASSDNVNRRAIELLTQTFLTDARRVDHPITSDQPTFWPAWIQFCQSSEEGQTVARPSSQAGAATANMGDLAVRASFVDESDLSLSELFITANDGRQKATSKTVVGQQAPTNSMRIFATRAMLPTDSFRDGQEAISFCDLDEQDSVSPQSVTIQPIAGAAATPTERQSTEWTFSQAAEAFLVSREKSQGDGRSREDAGIVFRFVSDLLGDRLLSEYDHKDFLHLEHALTDIPDRHGIPPEHVGTLHLRYLYAEKHGWNDLKRLSKTRLRNVYHQSLNKFFQWATKKAMFVGQIYKFDFVANENIEAKERDSWTDEELLKLFRLPLFTGAQSRERFWTPGPYFVQNELYWAYIIIFFLGMRPSEIGKLRTSDIVRDDGIWYVDLTKKKGTNDVTRRFKSRAAARRMPIPQLLIDLGLAERKAELETQGKNTLFPEWVPYRSPSGRIKAGHHFSKSWQYIKAKFDFTRDGLTLYGGRHTRAGWYDQAGIPQRIRDRLLGHAPSCVADCYGPILITSGEAAMVLSREHPIEAQIASILIEAKLAAMDELLTNLTTF